MSKKKITIREVAEHAGVSIAAVSYVLNGKEHKVSEDTIALIHESIKTLNYIPSMSARGLAKNTSQLIAVIIPQTEEHKQLVFENPFYSEMISNIEATVRSHGYHVLLAGVEKGQSYLDISVSRNLDGAILIGIYPEELYEECKQANIPIVLVDSYTHDHFFTNVGTDDELGGYLATKHLIDNGHTEIAIVTGSIKRDGVVEKRYLGYRRALEEANIPFKKDYVYGESVSFEHGHNAGCLIAQDYPDVTAIFATADVMAFGLIRGIMENGLSVPDDISIIGFDDISWAHMFFPPLTTVRQNIADKGRLAAQLLLDQIKGSNQAASNHMLVELEVISRNTVAKLSG